MLVFQGISRLADMRFYKHAAFSLLFLTPLAAEGVLRVARLAGRKLYPAVGAAAIALLAVSLGWAGQSWDTGAHVFWPNVEPIIAWFEGRLVPDNRVLIDDQGLRYYLEPVLPPHNLVEAYYFRYGELEGPPAYAAAIRDGYFDFVALDGSGFEEEVLQMRDAIHPVLPERYVLRMTMPEPALLRRVEIWERVNPPVAPAAPGPRVEITNPAGGTVVKTDGYLAPVEGRVTGAPQGAHLLAGLFTNRWYPQGDRIFPNSADGKFSLTVYLGGMGVQQCNHVIRVRLYDAGGRQLASAVNFNISRANPVGSAPRCP